MPNLIIADENQGRRNLLANNFERAGFDVTRTATLRQTVATGLATMPDVVIIDGEWSSGDPIDSAQKMNADAEFAFKSRIVLISRDTTKDTLISSAKAGINEVLGKPLDMDKLLSQVWKHAKKEYVPPPANISGPESEGFFDVNISMNDPTWALPMLKNIISPEILNSEFIEAILEKLEEDEVSMETLDAEFISKLLEVVFNHFIEITGSEEEAENSDENKKSVQNIPSEKKSAKLGTRVEDTLQEKADRLEEEIMENMDAVLNDGPPITVALPDDEKIGVDPEVIKMAQLVNEEVLELLWEIGVPGMLEDVTISSRVEESIKMVKDVLLSLNDFNEEEE